MRSFSIQPLSLVSGVVLAAVVFISMSQVWPAGQHVLVSYGPHPRDMVQIRDGTPYIVPPGKLFVLTALGAPDLNAQTASLFVDGQLEATAGTGSMDYTPDSRIHPMPSGFAVAPGSTITVSGGGWSGRAWGYLAPQ